MPARRTIAVIVLAAFLTACAGSASNASNGTSTPRPAVSPSGVGSDAAGDAVLRSGAMAPGYLDELDGSVSAPNAGEISFVDTLAEPIPQNPPLPAGDDALGWSFCVDTKPGLSPAGFPMTGPMPCEFIVHVRWDGDRRTAILIDRRPLVGGGDARVIKLAPVLDGSAVSVDIPIAALGHPMRFRWSMFTEELGPLGTDDAYHVDSVPDAGIDDPIPWRTE